MYHENKSRYTAFLQNNDILILILALYLQIKN